MSVNATQRSLLANYLLGQNSNKNYVKNQFGKDGTTNVSVSGTATVAKNTTTPLTGISDFLITLPNNATDYVEFALDTLDNALKNQNCMMSFDYLSTSVGSAVQAQIVINGIIVSTSNISTAPGQSMVRLNAPCGDLTTATTVRISNATGNTGTSSLNVANVNYGRADNVYDAPLVTAWQSYSLTITGATSDPTLGTVTTNQAFWRRVGDSMEIEYTLVQTTAGTSGSGAYLFSLPTGYTIDTAKITTSTTNINGAVGSAQAINPGVSLGNGQVKAYNSTKLAMYVLAAGASDSGNNVGSAYYALGNATISYSFKATVPIVGWSAVSAVSADQTDYDWTSYTPTFTGFGTVTSIECEHARIGPNLKIRCKGTAGTTTATEARISFPNSLTSADTTKIPSIYNCGNGSVGHVTATSYTALCEPSVGYFTIGFQNGAAAGLTKQLGNAIYSTGQTFSYDLSVPITGWSSNQRAPTLVGSVTSNASNAERIERAYITNSGTPTISSQSGSWITSLTDNGVGLTTFNLSVPFVTIPSCTANAIGGNRVVRFNSMAVGSFQVETITVASSPADVDSDFMITCMGPR